MKKHLIISMFAGALLLAFANAGLAKPAQQGRKKESQAELASQAKVNKEQAQATALKRRPGKVEDGELEREHGRLVYSFDIRNARGTIDEVQVSAITGRVVRIEHETLKQEAAEKKKEAKEKPE